MKILYILNSTLQSGGATKAFVSLVDELTKNGVEPYILMPDKEGIYEYFVSKGVSVKSLTYRMNAYPPVDNVKQFFMFIPKLLARLWVNHNASKALCKYIKEKKIDIVHTNVSVIDIGERAARKCGVPHVYHIREYADKDFNLKYFPSKKQMQERLKKSQTVCITKDIQKHHGLSCCDDSAVVYDGIYSKQYMPKTTQKQNYLLYAGRIEYTKGLDVLLRAYFQYVKKTSSPLKLLVAGLHNEQDKFYHDILQFVRENKLQEYVTFLGEIREIDEYMSQAKAVVIPSRYEGFGLVMAESMFNDTLVIGHNTAGTKEQFDNGKEFTGKEIGLRFDTEHQLVEMLKNINDAEHEEMIFRAEKTVKALYSTETDAEGIMQIYNKLLKKKDEFNKTI